MSSFTLQGSYDNASGKIIEMSVKEQPSLPNTFHYACPILKDTYNNIVDASRMSGPWNDDSRESNLHLKHAVDKLQSENKRLKMENTKTKDLIASSVHQSMKESSSTYTLCLKDTEQSLTKKVSCAIDNLRKEMHVSKSTKKVGMEGEDFVMRYVQHTYPKYQVSDTHGEPESGDFHTFIMPEEDDNVWILNEVKNHKDTVRTAEVNKFYRDVDKHKPPMAIMYSTYSNIVGKDNGKYEFRNDTTHIIFLSDLKSNPALISIGHNLLLDKYKYHSSSLFEDTREKEDCESKDTEMEEKLRKQEQETKRWKEVSHKYKTDIHVCTDALVSSDRVSILKYEKEIKKMKSWIRERENSIRDLKMRIKSFTNKQYEQGSYNNTDPTTKDANPYVCMRCHFKCKSTKQLFQHLKSKKHLEN